EVAGTVRRVALTPGQIVEPGDLLVALDVSVEEAELEAQKAQAALAQTTLTRLETLSSHDAVAQEEVDQARAARDVARARGARRPPAPPGSTSTKAPSSPPSRAWMSESMWTSPWRSGSRPVSGWATRSRS